MPTGRLDPDEDAARGRWLSQTNKRLTLNLLIQGAACHSHLTAHHLVRDELEEVRPGLVRLYDKLGVSLHLHYWYGDTALLHGSTSRFWRRAGEPSHPFHHHRLLALHGGELSRSSKRYLLARGREKGVIGVPGLHYAQSLGLMLKTAWAENRHRKKLEALAVRAVSLMWGIEESRLTARLAGGAPFRSPRTATTAMGRLVQQCAAGWGGVERRGNRFQVVAQAWFWPFVAHELAKGTAELICLHGLSSLDDDTYAQVMEEADRIEYEHWMLQAGGEVWRRLLAVIPRDRPMPLTLMHVARLSPESLEDFMLAVVSDPPRARRLAARLGE
jgi:hypothetical protein